MRCVWEEWFFSFDVMFVCVRAWRYFIFFVWRAHMKHLKLITATAVQVWKWRVWVKKRTHIFYISAGVVKHVLIRFRWLIAIVSKYYNMPFIFAFTGISIEFRSLTQSLSLKHTNTHIREQIFLIPFDCYLKMVQYIEREKWEKRTREFSKRMSAFIYHKINILLSGWGREREQQQQQLTLAD